MKPLICPRCRHANPAEARYCHHDGVLLEGMTQGQKASSRFANPFIFQSGRSCEDFKSLGQGMLAEWDSAREMLAFAEWEAFFTAMGRLDLAQAAAQARLFPDPDRGLDQLVCALPGFEANPGLLKVGSLTADFGTLDPCISDKVTISLENDGDRLVWGEAFLRDTPWCSLSAEGPLADRSFQFIKAFNLDLHGVPGKIRRMGRTLSGTLVLKSESKEITIPLSAREPEVIPFEGDLFAGATSPRQIAERARTKPREAAPLFNSGRVARWYEANGWSYPVSGPTAPGVASVQQFFEAHGFAPAPPIEIEPRAIHIRSVPGEATSQKIVLRTTEKRHVFGHALPTDTWIHAGELEPNYQSAHIPLTFDTSALKPDCPLTTTLTVIANGNQRFDIPIEIQAAALESPLLDLDSLALQVEARPAAVDSSPEMVEEVPIDAGSDLIEAPLVSTLSPANAAMTNDPPTAACPTQAELLTNPDGLPAPLAKPVFTPARPPSAQTPGGKNTKAINPIPDAIPSKDANDNESQSAGAKRKAKLGKKAWLALGGLGLCAIIVALIFGVLNWGGSHRGLGKELVRPLAAGKAETDLLSFTIETADNHRVSLLATETPDTGSHFMLQSGNFTGSVNSRKSSPKTVAKWQTKGGWSHREVDLSVGGNKWRVGQWLRALDETPSQCAVIFELSPLDRDSRISARLALRPGTGTGNSVAIFSGDLTEPFSKPGLLSSATLPEKLRFSIETPPTSGELGLGLKELVLPGGQGPITVATPQKILIGDGLDRFGPWDCQYPELFDESPSQPPAGVKGRDGKPVNSRESLKSPFLALYWDDSTVRKGQKRHIGFTLGIASQEGRK